MGRAASNPSKHCPFDLPGKNSSPSARDESVAGPPHRPSFTSATAWATRPTEARSGCSWGGSERLATQASPLPRGSPGPNPGALDLQSFKGRLEVETSHGSRTRDPRFEVSSSRADRRVTASACRPRSGHPPGVWGCFGLRRPASSRRRPRPGGVRVAHRGCSLWPLRDARPPPRLVRMAFGLRFSG